VAQAAGGGNGVAAVGGRRGPRTILKRPVPVWQKSFWDVQLRRGKSYDAKWEYVRANPVWHGLVSQPEDWPY